MPETVAVAPHPHLRLAGFVTHLGAPLARTPSPGWMVELLDDSAPAPLRRDEALRGAVRDCLRWGGHKPTGRGKPAAEYLVRAALDGLRSINLAVDACNVVSLHSGLPISVVDADLLRPPWIVRVADGGASYVFNPSGQQLRLDGLLCLHDAEGPAANAVKDSQRTKTHDGTSTTLSLVWGLASHPAHTDAAVAWYRALVERAGATTHDIELVAAT